jgi:hypothetical protein
MRRGDLSPCLLSSPFSVPSVLKRFASVVQAKLARPLQIGQGSTTRPPKQAAFARHNE